MTESKAARPMRSRRARNRAARWMNKHDWWKHHNSIRARVLSLTVEGNPWWDWGHKLMIVTGSDFGGNWSEPEPPTWYYRRGEGTRMWRTGYPRHPFRTFEIVTTYDEFRARTEGLNEDGLYKWQAINVDQDGQLQLGHRYWGKAFYGLPPDEVTILRRYLRMWRRYDWFGLRSWLYSQGLHAAVHRKKPRSCGASAPRGQGGYDHWRCQLSRKHDGFHRFNNYTWGEIDGEPIGTMYQPEDSNA